MIYLIILAIGLVVVGAAVIMSDWWSEAPGGAEHRRGGGGQRWRARGQIISGERISGRRFGLDCLVAEPASVTNVGVPVFSLVTGPVLGWPGLSLVDLVADWCADDQPLTIELLAGTAGGQAKVIRGNSMVMLDVENVREIRALLDSEWLHQHQH